jgi:hypothetical protein
MMEAARRVSWLLRFVSAGVVETSWRRGWRRHEATLTTSPLGSQASSGSAGRLGREAAAIRVTDVENLLVLGRGCR